MTWLRVICGVRGCSLGYTHTTTDGTPRSDALRDALTVDALAKVPLGKGLTLVARGENLFDEKVVTRNQAGSIDLGTPRMLWIGFRFAT